MFTLIYPGFDDKFSVALICFLLIYPGCADKVLGSDHRPVFASFNVGITSDFVMNRNSLTSESLIKIVFHQVVAQVIFFIQHQVTFYTFSDFKEKNNYIDQVLLHYNSRINMIKTNM